MPTVDLRCHSRGRTDHGALRESPRQRTRQVALEPLPWQPVGSPTSGLVVLPAHSVSPTSSTISRSYSATFSANNRPDSIAARSFFAISRSRHVLHSRTLLSPQLRPLICTTS